MARRILHQCEPRGSDGMRLGNAVSTSLAAAAALSLACAKGEQSNAAADSTARNLTLAPSETSAARHDVPAPERAPVETKKAPATRPKPATPPAPTIYTAAAGTHLDMAVTDTIDRKSTRLNSSHVRISYAVLCLEKKK